MHFSAKEWQTAEMRIVLDIRKLLRAYRKYERTKEFLYARSAAEGNRAASSAGTPTGAGPVAQDSANERTLPISSIYRNR